LQQWSVRREYLKRLKDAFDEHGIEIPFPQMTLHTRNLFPAPTPMPTASGDAGPAASAA
jgi:moderate conductance mechanosensitive channel